jgi:type IV pilus assembly protein PilM
VAAKRLQLKDRLAKIEALGLPVDLVQGDALALHNYLTYEYETRMGSPAPTKHDDANAVTAVIDMGNDTMNVMVFAPRLAWFHNCGLGGYSFTKALVKELRVSSAQAEQIKRAPTTAVDLAPVFTAMEAVFETVAEEVQSALAVFAKTHRHKRIAGILGVGGGFQIHGLLRYLRFGR